MRNEHIRVYVTEETKHKIQQKAKKEGLKPSPWLRKLAKKHLENNEAEA